MAERRHETLAGALISAVKAPLLNFRAVRSLGRLDDIELQQSTNGSEAASNDSVNVFWALRDVSFEVCRGEAIGIIGRNGAGKSTLLKILSRITEPSGGRASIHGRVASLLEVGTGFHPDLTGRENVYLNGTILGLRKREVDAKFEEIVSFSGVEGFVDTPVKRYSSGMRVRLAFAVAAHLEPEVLVVDEVLAVGDAAFQAKCMGKMNDVARRGRTVLFVSHSMGAVRELCSRAIVLDHGSVAYVGPVESAIAAYLSEAGVSGDSAFEVNENKPLQILRMTVQDGNGEIRTHFNVDDTIVVVVRFVVRRRVLGGDVAANLSRNGVVVWNTLMSDCDPGGAGGLEPGNYARAIRLPMHLLKAGQYTMSASTGVPRETFDVRRDALCFRVEETLRNPHRGGIAEHRPGFLRVQREWCPIEVDAVLRVPGRNRSDGGGRG